MPLAYSHNVESNFSFTVGLLPLLKNFLIQIPSPHLFENIYSDYVSFIPKHLSCFASLASSHGSGSVISAPTLYPFSIHLKVYSAVSAADGQTNSFHYFYCVYGFYDWAERFNSVLKLLFLTHLGFYIPRLLLKFLSLMIVCVSRIDLLTPRFTGIYYDWSSHHFVQI